jgi:hypothetical protein
LEQNGKIIEYPCGVWQADALAGVPLNKYMAGWVEIECGKLFNIIYVGIRGNTEIPDKNT